MIGLAVAALLLVQDPLGDTTGAGFLSPPTAAIYQSRGPFDITALELMDTPTLSIKLALGSLANPLDLPLDFSFPIIELYLSDATPGDEALLPGSGMRLPDGASWHYPFQLSGEALRVFVAEAGTTLELSGAGDVRADGTSLILETSLPRPEEFTLFGMVGQYSPFTATGWQPLSLTPSPWAFSSPTQAYPVIDVISAREDLQERALQTGVLPGLRRAPAPNIGFGFNTWIGLMGLGLLTALAGLVGRLTQRRPAPALPQRAHAPVEGSAETAQTEPSPLPSEAADSQAGGCVFEDEDATLEAALADTRRDRLTELSDDKDSVKSSDIAVERSVLSEEGWLEVDTDTEALSDWETFDEPSSEELREPRQRPLPAEEFKETPDKP